MICNFHVVDWVCKTGEESDYNVQEEGNIDDRVNYDPLYRLYVFLERQSQRHNNRREQECYHNVDVKENLFGVRLVYNTLNRQFLVLGNT